MDDSISVYMQVYRQKRAVFEALRSFRTHYKNEPVTVLSDDGDDFSEICDALNARYIHATKRMHTGPDLRTGNVTTLDGINLFLDRVYEHCTTNDSDWVVFLWSGTRTIRRIRTFPTTAVAGARTNPFSRELTDILTKKFGHKLYAYGCSGGGIFSRKAFLSAYASKADLANYLQYDDGIALYSDLAFGLLFLISGFEYCVWDEVSEIFHEAAPIIRDSAFDHGYKYWYDKDFDPSLMREVNG